MGSSTSSNSNGETSYPLQRTHVLQLQGSPVSLPLPRGSLLRRFYEDVREKLSIIVKQDEKLQLLNTATRPSPRVRR